MAREEDPKSKVQQNRRRTLRSPLIVLRAKLKDSRKTFFGYAKNISRGGMFIGSVKPQTPGLKFDVEFPLPSHEDEMVCCQCEVVWNRPFSNRGVYDPGMGLRFLDISPKKAQAIDDWANTSGD